MNELLRSELLRYRLWTAALAAIHLAVLGFFTRIVDPLQQPLLVYQLAGGIYALCGFLLGLHQFGTHRRSSSWLFLLHRPVAPRRIAFALVGSGAISLAVAMALPLALIIGGQALWSARVVDLRHALLPLAALLISGSAYLAGAFTVLSPARFAILVLVAPALALTGAAQGLGAIAVQALVAAALLALVAGVFKPDLTTPPRTVATQLTNALPLALGANFLLVVVGGLAVQIVWIVLGTHPLNSTPPRGGFVEASRAEGKDLLDAGLAAGVGADAEDLAFEREQVRISDVWTTAPAFERLAARSELTNFAPVEIDDARRNLRITFSHDTSRFHRLALADGSAAGSIGLGAEPGLPFDSVPIVDGAGVAIVAGAVYRYDAESGEWRRWLRVPAGETVAATPETAGEAIALLTDRALLLYEPRAAAEGAELSPRLRVELPAPVGDIARVDFVERLDGLLVSFVAGRGTVDSPGAAWQEVVRVDGDGSRKSIVRRALSPDFPTLLRYRRQWISPLLANVEARLRNVFAPANPLAARAPSDTPRPVLGLALMLHLAAAGIAYRMLAGRALAGSTIWIWVAACGLAGPPATIALWLLQPERLGAKVPAGSRSTPRPEPLPTGSNLTSGLGSAT